jgi:hypothetical protein
MAPPSDMPAPGMDAPGMPPAPGMDAPATENTLSEIPDGSNLTPPSLPGSGLDDIKSQVVGDMPVVESSNELPQKQEIDNSAFETPEISSDEDLFNMFKVEDSELASTPEPAQATLPSTVMEQEKQEDDSYTPQAIETHTSNDVALNFETKKVSKKDETIFLTTTQFKALLEVVDSVKGKIKTSTETHLKLMDMKAEEDVEYESLRRNFQFIEDKLHDLDGILFDN